MMDIYLIGTKIKADQNAVSCKNWVKSLTSQSLSNLYTLAMEQQNICYHL